MTKYTVISTNRFIRSLNNFLKKTSDANKKHLKNFESIFDNDPFDTRLQTHIIRRDLQRNAILYSSYITRKIRLLRVLQGDTIIIIYQVMTDHDYHKVSQLKQYITSIIDDIMN